MAVSMIGPKFYAWDRCGKPLAFGKLYTYQARTNTPKPTYQSEDQAVANTNPVVLNGEGYANIYLSGSYKMVLKDKDDNEIWTSDPVSESGGDSFNYTLTALYSSSNKVSVYGNHYTAFPVGAVVAFGFNDAGNEETSTVESVVVVNGKTEITVMDPIVRPSVNLISTSSGLAMVGEFKDSMEDARQNYADINIRGDYAPNTGSGGTIYALRDVVKDAAGDGAWYITVEAFTSTTLSADIASGYLKVWQGLTREDGILSVNSISDLQGVTLAEGFKVNVTSYHDGLNAGGGTFVWSTGRHNGGTFIDPNRAFPTDWNDQSQLVYWFEDSGYDVSGFLRIDSDDIKSSYFGVFMDEGSDDTIQINSADKYAKSKNKALIISEGTHYGYGFTGTTSWIAESNRKSVIKSNQVDPENRYAFCVFPSVSDLSIGGIVFDGNVSDDPVVWSPENYNSFTGAIPLVVGYSENLNIFDCIFQNAKEGCLRLDGCVKSDIDNCRFIRSRGEYGDGVYSVSCEDITYTNCYAFDYTRIGFVSEGSITGMGKSSKYKSCTADYGHDQGADYGGGEYNSGFWTENSDGTSYEMCLAKNNSQFGYVASSTLSQGLPNSYSYTDCVSKGAANVGFSIQANEDRSVFNLSGCRVYDSSICYSSKFGDKSEVSFNNCWGKSTGSINSSTSNSAIFRIEGFLEDSEFKVSIRDCSGEFINYTGYNDISVNTAHISVGEKNAATILVSNFNETLGFSPLIKDRLSSNTSWYVRECDIKTYILPQNPTGFFDFDGGSLSGSVRSMSIYLNCSLSNDLALYHGTVIGKLNMKEFRLSHFDGAPYPNKPVIMNINVNSKRNIVNDGYAIRLYYTNEEKAIINGYFENTGIASVNQNDYYVYGEQNGIKIYTNGLVSDSSIQYTIKVLNNLTPLPENEQRISIS